MTNTFFIVLFLYYSILYLYTLSKIDVQSSLIVVLIPIMFFVSVKSGDLCHFLG